MKVLTIIGWLVIAGIGVWLFVGATLMAYLEGGFTGRVGPMAYIGWGMAAVFLWLAYTLAPFHLSMNP